MAANVFRKCSLCLSVTKQLRLSSPAISRRYQSSVDSADDNVDIVISGGGMVGASMACALGNEDILQNKKIVLLEAGQRKPYTMSEKFDNRTCTLSPASVSLFQSFGAWDEILQMRCHPVKRMQVWESCSNSLITFNQDDMMDNLAYVAENSIILEAVTRRLDALQDRIQVLYGTKSEKIDIPKVHGTSFAEQSGVKITLNNGKTLNTKLLIGSDGMNSQVRKAANFHTLKLNYNQTAVVAILNFPEGENTVAWQRFLPTGPIALLPLSDSAGSLIWTTTPEHAKELLSQPAESFVDSVNDAFWHERDINTTAAQLGDKLQALWNTVLPDSAEGIRQLPPTATGVQDGSKAAFPLGLCHSSNYIKSRVALIGDAAHRLHPLAGQGVNLGFGDVSTLKEVLTKAVFDGSDIGSADYLKEYETKRQRKILPVIATIDGLQRLYSTDFAPLVLLRSMGLQATNSLPKIKDWIMKEASR